MAHPSFLDQVRSSLSRTPLSPLMQRSERLWIPLVCTLLTPVETLCITFPLGFPGCISMSKYLSRSTFFARNRYSACLCRHSLHGLSMRNRLRCEGGEHDRNSICGRSLEHARVRLHCIELKQTNVSPVTACLLHYLRRAHMPGSYRNPPGHDCRRSTPRLLQPEVNVVPWLHASVLCVVASPAGHCHVLAPTARLLGRRYLQPYEAPSIHVYLPCGSNQTFPRACWN